MAKDAKKVEKTEVTEEVTVNVVEKAEPDPVYSPQTLAEMKAGKEALAKHAK